MEGCAMGQGLHGCARTTEAIRRAIQHSQESIKALARRHGINPKTVAKWRAHEDVADQRTGPITPRSTSLIAEVRTEQGKLHLFVAIDRTSKFAFVQLHE